MSAMIKVGDSLPDVQVIRGESEKVSIRELFAGKKGVLFAVPGAFTPTCTKEHLPGFVNNIEALKAAGAEEVACIATNDAFVMTAWGAAASAGGKVTILADPHAEFTKAVGMDSEKITEFLGAGLRSLRYSLVIKDSVVQFVNVEEAGGLTCSAAEPAIEQVKSL